MRKKLFFLVSIFLFFPLLSKAQETPQDFQKGMNAYKQGDYQSALQNFKDAVNDDPDSWQSYEMEGNCYYYLRDPEDMKSAFEQSLKIHPNPELAARQVKLLQTPPPVMPAPAPQTGTPSNPLETPGSRPSVIPFVETNGAAGNLQSFDLKIPKENFNLHFYSGLDVAFMDDLINGLTNWANSEKSFSNVSGDTVSFNRVGYINGIELKKTFGHHEFSVGGEIITGAGGEADINNTDGTVGKVIIHPTVFELGFNYSYHFFPTANLRPYVSLGAGFYQVDAQYSNPYSAIPGSSPSGYYAQGDFDSSTFGGELGAGMEWAVDKGFSIDLLGRFRAATFNQLVSTNLNGSDVLNSGPYALEIYNNKLYFIDQAYVGQSGRRYAVLDYSGLDLMLGIHFYFGGDPLPKSPKRAEPANPAGSLPNTQPAGSYSHNYLPPAASPTPDGSVYAPPYGPRTSPYH